jgi:hypothetical protein
MARRERELATWRGPPKVRTAVPAAPPAEPYFPMPVVPQAAPKPEPPPAPPKPASAPKPEPPPDQTRVVVPEEINVEASGRRYRTNFNRKPPVKTN